MSSAARVRLVQSLSLGLELLLGFLLGCRPLRILHLALLFQPHSKELYQKWSSQKLNRCTTGGGLTRYTMVLAPYIFFLNPHVDSLVLVPISLNSTSASWPVQFRILLYMECLCVLRCLGTCENPEGPKLTSMPSVHGEIDLVHGTHTCLSNQNWLFLFWLLPTQSSSCWLWHPSLWCCRCTWVGSVEQPHRRGFSGLLSNSVLQG